MNKYNVLVQKGKTNMNYCDLQNNCELVTELRQALLDIQAIAGKSKNYSSTATKIFDKCSEVLCQARGKYNLEPET